jgi:preprotein translocase subunit SecG
VSNEVLIPVILAIHVIVAVILVGVVLLQKSEGGALGIGGGGGGGFMTARGSTNLLSRTTAILATVFFITSISLAILSGAHTKPRSIIDQPASTAPGTPQPPSVPLAR